MPGLGTGNQVGIVVTVGYKGEKVHNIHSVGAACVDDSLTVPLESVMHVVVS